MLVHAIAGVQHRQPGDLGQKVRRPGRKMAQDNALRPQRPQRNAGVFQRFTLLDRRRLGTDQRRVRAQALGRQLERGPGAGAGFVEEQRHPPMGQPPGARDRVFLLKLGGQVEDGGDIIDPQ